MANAGPQRLPERGACRQSDYRALLVFWERSLSSLKALALNSLAASAEGNGVRLSALNCTIK